MPEWWTPLDTALLVILAVALIATFGLTMWAERSSARSREALRREIAEYRKDADT